MNKSDPYAVLRISDFRQLQVTRFLLTFSIQMAETILGWKIYAITHDKLALGLIGLSEALPFIVTSFYSGHAADTYSRFRIVKISIVALLACFIAITAFMFNDASILRQYGVMPIYIAIGFSGIARGFLSPAIQSILPMIVPRNLYTNSATWNSTTWQTAAVTGPAVGGILYGILAQHYYNDLPEIIVFSLACVILFFSLLAFSGVKPQSTPPKQIGETLSESLRSGLNFVFKKEEMLAAISLDLFAVLFGGAVALLPVFASDILHVGPGGLGILRAAPFLGSVCMGFFLVFFPPNQNAGRNLFFAVMMFGLATIGFAISESFVVSFVMLFLTGAFDNVSVVIRQTILQIMTPNDMRGRVSAVNQIFVSSSNEIGAFESGLAAKLMGTVPSVIFGGTMTLLVVIGTFALSPKIRKLKL